MAYRSEDDAGSLRQHGDDPHRRVQSADRDSGNARDNLLTVHGVRGVEGQTRDVQVVQYRHCRGCGKDVSDVWWVRGGGAAVCFLCGTHELPTIQQDEGDGADRELVCEGRESPQRRYHRPVPRLRPRDRSAVPWTQVRDLRYCRDSRGTGGQVRRPHV